ncbi:MAG: bacteriohemerythrin [Anaeromyxobacteraceae bacterium]
MPPRAWDENIGTGVNSMDAEHRLQVSLVNAIEELVRSGRDPELTGKTTAQLVDFTNVHFLSEELMMRLYSYPQHDAHNLEHARLIEQVADIQRQVASGESAAALEGIAALHDWLTQHIRSMDQAFALWCAKNHHHPQ